MVERQSQLEVLGSNPSGPTNQLLGVEMNPFETLYRDLGNAYVNMLNADNNFSIADTNESQQSVRDAYFKLAQIVENKLNFCIDFAKSGEKDLVLFKLSWSEESK